MITGRSERQEASVEELRLLRQSLSSVEWQSLRFTTKLEAHPLMKRKLVSAWFVAVVIYFFAIPITQMPTELAYVIGICLGALGLFLFMVPLFKDR